MGLPEPSKDQRGSPTLKESHSAQTQSKSRRAASAPWWPVEVAAPAHAGPLFFQVAWAGVTHTAGGRRAQPPSFSLPFGGVSSTRLTHSSNLSLQLTGGAHVSTSGEQNSPQPPPSALVPGHLWISSSASRISAHMRRARWGPAASLDFGWERSPSPGPGPGTDQTRKPRESRHGDGVDSATVGLFQAIHQEAGGGVLQDGRDVPEQDPPLPLPRVSWARGAGSSLNFNLSEN